MTDIYKELGKRIRVLRKAAGLTQFELAELAEINDHFLGKIERGDSGVSLLTLQKLSHALGVSLPKLVDVKAEQPPKAKALTDKYLQRIVLRLRTKNAKVLKSILKIIDQIECITE